MVQVKNTYLNSKLDFLCVYSYLCTEYLTSLPSAMPLQCRHLQLEVEPGVKPKPFGL